MRKWQTGTKWLGAGTQRFSPLGHLFKLSQSAQIRLEQLFACFAAKGHGFKSEYSVPPPLTHVLEGSTESAWIQALPSPREVASPSQGEACGRGSRGVAALSLTGASVLWGHRRSCRPARPALFKSTKFTLQERSRQQKESWIYRKRVWSLLETFLQSSVITLVQTLVLFGIGQA